MESWKDWAKAVDLAPLAIERTVYCEQCGYAGTLDLYARVHGRVTVIDWKTGRAIYPEAFFQNVAYRHAARQHGPPSDCGMIVCLPKVLTVGPGKRCRFQRLLGSRTSSPRSAPGVGNG